jgi:hypothetical protein
MQQRSYHWWEKFLTAKNADKWMGVVEVDFPVIAE